MDFHTNLTLKVQKGRGLGSRDPISKFWDGRPCKNCPLIYSLMTIHEKFRFYASYRVGVCRRSQKLGR